MWMEKRGDSQRPRTGLSWDPVTIWVVTRDCAGTYLGHTEGIGVGKIGGWGIGLNGKKSFSSPIDLAICMKASHRILEGVTFLSH